MTATVPTLCLRLDGIDTDELASLIVDTLEALAQANALWYLGQWGRKHDPPVTCTMARVQWCPDDLGYRTEFVWAPELHRLGRGSCGSIAAADLGAHRAIALRRGEDPARVAKDFRIALERHDPRYWHAVLRVRGRRFDPTEGLQRCAA
jgi:hypothetical protein